MHVYFFIVSKIMVDIILINSLIRARRSEGSWMSLIFLSRPAKHVLCIYRNTTKPYKLSHTNQVAPGTHRKDMETKFGMPGTASLKKLIFEEYRERRYIFR